MFHRLLRRMRGFGLGVLLLVTVGCQGGGTVTGAAVAPDNVLRRSHSRFSEETSQRIYTYEVQPVEGKLELCIRIALQTGVQRWELTDPTTRQIRWNAEASPGQTYRASHCFEAESGTWELHVEIEAATGEYEVTWQQLVDAKRD